MKNSLSEKVAEKIQLHCIKGLRKRNITTEQKEIKTRDVQENGLRGVKPIPQTNFRNIFLFYPLRTLKIEKAPFFLILIIPRHTIKSLDVNKLD